MNDNKTYRKSLFILSTIAVGLNLLMFIPFGKSFGSAEVLVKFILLPIVVAALNIIITLKKFGEYRPTNRFQSFASYLPIFSYLVASFIYVIFMVNRAEPTIAFSYSNYIFLMIGFATLAVGTICLLYIMDKVNLSLSKNQVNVIDILMYVAFALDIILMRVFVLDPYINIALNNSSVLNIIFGIVIGGAVLYLLFARLFRFYRTNEEFVVRDKNELIEKWCSKRNEAYSNAELVILYALHNYAKERFDVEESKISVQEGYVNVNSDELSKLKAKYKELKTSKSLADAKHQKMKAEYIALQNKVKLDVAKTELEGLEKQFEILNASITEENARLEDDIKQYEEEKRLFDEKLEQLEKEKAALLAELNFESIEQAREKERQEAEAKAANAIVAKPKIEKVFKPSYEEMVSYAQSLEGENLSVVINPAGNQHKFLVGKKPYLLMQKTNSDYRITFCVNEEDILGYLRNYPGEISVAKSPKGGNFLKISNTGELDEEFLKKLISEALPAELNAEKNALLAKEAEKQAKLEAKEQEKRNRELLREAERIVARAKREEEKAALKAKKEAEKQAAKLAAQKMKEENGNTSEENVA